MVKTISRLTLVFLCVIISSFSISGAEPPKGKRLVIINSYNEGAPWAQDFVTRVMQEVSSRPGFQTVETVHLNCTTIHDAEDYDDMADGLFKTLDSRHPDYLVLIGNFAFTLRDRFRENWGDIPMVLISMSDELGDMDYYFTRPEGAADSAPPVMTPIASLRDDYNFTMIVTPNKYRETIDMMVAMLPGMKKLVFVADPLYVNRALSRDIKTYVSARYPDMTYEWLVGSEANGRLLKQCLDHDDPSEGLLLSTWFVEKENVHGHPQLIAGEARMISGSRRPVFGLRYSYLYWGVLGGVFVSPDRSWHYARAAILDMLDGRDLRTVPVHTVEEAWPVVNWPVLVKDGISPSSCPPATRFIDRPKTLWEQYHMHIIAGIAVCVALAALALVIALANRRTRHTLALRNHLIDELHHKETMLIAAREKAEESDRMKLAFLANMSHEIRTPLNAIVGFSDILCRTSDAAKRERFMKIIQTNNQLLLKLVGDVLDVAKIESNTLEFVFRPVDINSLLADIADTASLRLQKGVEIVCLPGRPEMILQTDPGRLSQVLGNLLSNAAKFTAEGSIRFGYDVDGRMLRFFVRDTGMGIPDEDLPRLFKRFSKLNRFSQGNGLGLSICKSIVERLGGEIGVSSQLGHGTEFWFTIPVSDPTDQV